MELTKEDLVWLKADMRTAKDKKMDSLVEWIVRESYKESRGQGEGRERAENK